ncbi:hypothetical protein Q427_22255 [Halomonas sp. BC04]|nr:hypothetical protein Q427_22255 [Halomonas sp. BC04]
MEYAYIMQMLYAGSEMREIAFLILGWLLGLLSPLIVDAVRRKRIRRDLVKAIKTESEDLQSRVVVSSFLLAQRYGDLSREYLNWLSPKLQAYRGCEPIQRIRDLVDHLISAPDEEFNAMREHMRAEPEVGLSLKRFSASLIETAAPQIIHFPSEYQRRIHEFKNQMYAMNQEIERATVSLDRTFDSSLSDENHERVKNDLESKYIFIQGMCERVADRLQDIIDFDIKNI